MVCGRPHRDGLGRLRHLTFDNSKMTATQSLPRMTHLCSLDVRFYRGHLADPAARHPLVDLSRFTRLDRLHIVGDMWSSVQQQFVGACPTITTCILQGPLVLGKRSDVFFARIAANLRYLLCQGTHMISELDTPFPRLEFVALHDTVHHPGVFPFRASPIRAVSLQVSDSYGPYRLEDHNALLRLVLDNTRTTLKLLALRSGLMWAPDTATVWSLHSMSRLSALILDGAVVLDRRARHHDRPQSSLELVAIIDSWIETSVSRLPDPTVTRVTTDGHDRSGVLPDSRPSERCDADANLMDGTSH